MVAAMQIDPRHFALARQKKVVHHSLLSEP